VSSPLIDRIRVLASARAALGTAVLDAAWRVFLRGGGPGPMPLHPDAKEPTYWTRRATPLQSREQYEKPY
jgi:hypothetical protein